MSDTEQVEIPAPDAIAAPETEAVADPSPAKADENKETVSKVQSRFDELTRFRREAERERDYWREQALRNSPPPPKPEPVPDEKPKTLADFDYDEAKYQGYILSEARRQSVEAAKRELSAEREREAAQRRKTSFVQRSTEFAKTVEDYDSVVSNPRLHISADMAEVIEDSEDGPALAYHLGKNPDVADKIAQLPPKAAARELGKIEAHLAFEREKAKEKQVSKTPPPPPKVEGSGTVLNVKPDSVESDSLSDEEWTRRRNKQVSRRS